MSAMNNVIFYRLLVTEAKRACENKVTKYCILIYIYTKRNAKEFKELSKCLKFVEKNKLCIKYFIFIKKSILIITIFEWPCYGWKPISSIVRCV